MFALDHGLGRADAVRLPAGTIHVWTVHLDQPAPVVSALEAILSTDELNRANRFAFDHLRRRFVVCRGALRQTLGAYVGVRPESIAFEYGRRGKPALRHDGSFRPQFNVSHAEELAAIAVSAEQPVGVDVEWLQRTVDFEGLATRFFSNAETLDLLSLARHDRRAGFYNGWTRKEAYIKAIGDGLACPLDSFTVALRPGDHAEMRWIAGDDAARWTVQRFYPAPGYVGAVAAPFRLSEVCERTWTDVASR
jgi:4'-phosphopantetheinyl transferase